MTGLRGERAAVLGALESSSLRPLTFKPESAATETGSSLRWWVWCRGEAGMRGSPAPLHPWVVGPASASRGDRESRNTEASVLCEDQLSPSLAGA